MTKYIKTTNKENILNTNNLLLCSLIEQNLFICTVLFEDVVGKGSPRFPVLRSS